MILLIGISFLLLSVVIIAIVLRISSQVNERLNQMNQSIQEANKIIGQSLGSATNIFGNVQASLGRLEETNKRVYEVGKDISGLQELLRAPKFRGKMGEVFLENLLSQVLPKEYYQPQYKFKSGDTVDAVIKLGERIVPIDAKFSLENFKKSLDSPDEQEKNIYRRKFIQDVKMRIDEVASKYILPGENTYDFGLMYIPAENVYYEIIITQDLFSYSAQKKVFMVSPNTFYAYLQVICLGLKGLKVEENAREILKNLGMLAGEIGKFREDFDLLGMHLLNAGRKYEDSQKKLERFSDKLINIQDAKDIEAKEGAYKL